MSVIGGSGSYSTTMRSTASSATYRLSAAIIATASPTVRTLPSASGGKLVTLTAGVLDAARTGFDARAISSPVSTAVTPGSASAAEASMATIRACAWGERRNAA